AETIDTRGHHEPAETGTEAPAGAAATDDAANEHAAYRDGQYGEQERPVDIDVADVASKANQRVDGNDKQGSANGDSHGRLGKHDQRRDDQETAARAQQTGYQTNANTKGR